MKIHIKEFDNTWFAVAVTPDGEVLACSFSRKSRYNALHELEVKIGPKSLTSICEKDSSNGVLTSMKDLYDGKTISNHPKIYFKSQTSFERGVYRETSAIPRGFVSTYLEIAKSLKKEKAARAVGIILKRNPTPLFIPCHRVIRSNLQLGHYSPSSDVEEGMKLKKRILIREGVTIRNGKVFPQHLWRF